MNLPRVDKYIIVILILAGLALAIQEAYVWKDLANLWDTDLISYIDNGEAFWRGDFNHFVNLYWSPLYGILVALVLKLAGSTIDNELLLTRATNLVIYGIVCLSFLYFVETLKHFLQKRFKNEERACLESYWGLSLLTLTAVFFYSTLTLGANDVWHSRHALHLFCLPCFCTSTASSRKARKQRNACSQRCYFSGYCWGACLSKQGTVVPVCNFNSARTAACSKKSQTSSRNNFDQPGSSCLSL